MLQNKFLFFFIFIFTYSFSQQKIDTVYVYEEVIVHDTIYVEKTIDKLKLENIVFTKGEKDEKGKIELIQNGKKIEINVDSTNIFYPKLKLKTPKKSWFFGGKFLSGLSSNSLFKDLNASNSYGFGLGLWSRKQLFESNLYLGAGLDGFYWWNSFSLEASTNNNRLNGYYFTNSQKPLLFKGIESKNFQFQIPLQLYYNYKKFMPSIGVFASISNYKSEFQSSSGKLPLSLDETQVFETQALQIGYLAELQYEISKHISVGINFSFGKAKNLVFINKGDSNQSFKTQNSFSENRFLLELVYKL